jgi:hypothetical protein
MSYAKLHSLILFIDAEYLQAGLFPRLNFSPLSGPYNEVARLLALNAYVGTVHPASKSGCSSLFDIAPSYRIPFIAGAK